MACFDTGAVGGVANYKGGIVGDDTGGVQFRKKDTDDIDMMEKNVAPMTKDFDYTSAWTKQKPIK